MNNEDRRNEINNIINSLIDVSNQLEGFLEGEYYSTIDAHRRQSDILEIAIKALKMF